MSAFSDQQLRAVRAIVAEAIRFERQAYEPLLRAAIRAEILAELQSGDLAAYVRSERRKTDRMSLAQARFEAQLGGALPPASNAGGSA